MEQKVTSKQFQNNEQEATNTCLPKITLNATGLNALNWMT